MTDAELKYTIFQTDAGWVGMLRSDKGLQCSTLPQPSPEEARRQLGGDWLKYAEWSPSAFDDLTKRLKAYFSGHRVAFTDRLDLFDATPFQREVWEKTRLIPYGETRTYSWVAQEIGKPGAVRAVGQALARNPLPIIVPCHRVVASNGRLGGYRGGLGMKQQLLSREASGNPYSQVQETIFVFLNHPLVSEAKIGVTTDYDVV